MMDTNETQDPGRPPRLWVSPRRGSFTWQPESAKLQVPKQAREAIIRIGLMGAVGEFGIDDVDVRASE